MCGGRKKSGRRWADRGLGSDVHSSVAPHSQPRIPSDSEWESARNPGCHVGLSCRGSGKGTTAAHNDVKVSENS